MKTVIKYLFLLFVFASCNNSENFHESPNIDTVLVYKHDTISDCLPYACIDGVYGGKISKKQLLNGKEITLLNNYNNYKILSFRCVSRADVNNRIQNLGPFFNDEIMKVFESVQAGSILYFENIRAVNMNKDTVVLNSIIVHLPT